MSKDFATSAAITAFCYRNAEGKSRHRRSLSTTPRLPNLIPLTQRDMYLIDISTKFINFNFALRSRLREAKDYLI